VFLDPANFPEDLAADVPHPYVDFLAHAQMPTAATVFTNPAWKQKPSWNLVAKADKTIDPDLERMYAERAKSHKVEVEGASHAVYISHPEGSRRAHRGSGQGS
jgi:pimeloyl-ACP methyl ester carboxylesterase